MFESFHKIYIQSAHNEVAFVVQTSKHHTPTFHYCLCYRKIALYDSFKKKKLKNKLDHLEHPNIERTFIFSQSPTISTG